MSCSSAPVTATSRSIPGNVAEIVLTAARLGYLRLQRLTMWHRPSAATGTAPDSHHH